MKKTERVNALVRWGHAVAAMLEEMESGSKEEGNQLKNIVQQAYIANPWFVNENSRRAIGQCVKMLERKNIESWLAAYEIPEVEHSALNVGIIMAGNIPLVGFHDLISVLVCGHCAVIKCASDDQILLPFLLEVLKELAPGMKNLFTVVPRFGKVDAVIATGSNNSSRYFEYYFGKMPHIIRKNRNSVAVLDGSEGPEELKRLGDDIFSYFGLGCRNVSKLFVPSAYQFDLFFRAIEVYGGLMQHNKYMNNFDYHRALYLLNNEPFLTNNFLLLREQHTLSTPVSVLHFERYDSVPGLQEKLTRDQDQIQCIAGKDYLPFGTLQEPGLTDYADGVDTLRFLTRLPS